MRRYVNLMITMLLGGLWHGAGWTFVVWGGLHGVYLMVNHLWRDRMGEAQPRGLAQAAAWAVTLLAVVVAWVFFRAGTLHAAFVLLRGMAGLNGWGGPGWDGLARAGLAMALALLAPNSQQILRGHGLGLQPAAAPGILPQLWWRPNRAWALGLGLLAAVSVARLWSGSEFIYYQF